MCFNIDITYLFYSLESARQIRLRKNHYIMNTLINILAPLKQRNKCSINSLHNTTRTHGKHRQLYKHKQHIIVWATVLPHIITRHSHMLFFIGGYGLLLVS